MSTRILKHLAFAVILLGAILALPQRSFAQSNGLGITPELNYEVKAGTELSDTLYVHNLSTSQTLTIKLSVIDFQSDGDTGTPKLLLSANAPQTPWSLKPYLTLPDIVTVGPGASKFIPFTIKFPASVGAGSYYSAVGYAAVTGTDQQKVNIAASADTLLFVNVPGDATEQLSMVQFGAESGSNFSSVFSSPPSTFAYLVKNSGNLAESPAGSIVIKNIFGHIVAHIDNANPQSELALIGQTRKFEVCSPKSTNQADIGKASNCTALNIKPGMYTAEIELLYGQNGQPSHQIGAQAAFWYLPLWFVVVFILILLLIAYAIYYLYHKFTGIRHHHHKHR